MRQPAKANHVTGAFHTELAADLKAQYEQGASIRALAKTTGRSYGFVSQMLNEAQVTRRSQGRPRHPGPS